MPGFVPEVQILADLSNVFLRQLRINPAQRDIDQGAEDQECLLVFARGLLATGSQQQGEYKEEVETMRPVHNESLAGLQFLFDTVHQCGADIELVKVVQFTDAGGAGHVDLGQIISDHIQADE